MMLQELPIVPSADSRMELLAWLNQSMPHTAPNGFNIPTVRRVESCGNFVPYLLMLPNMLPVPYPPLTNPARVKVPARLEFEAVANLKLLNDALHRNGVVRPDVLINDSEKLIRGNFQANFSFLQWFKGFHDALLEAGIEAGQGRVTGLSSTPVLVEASSDDEASGVLGPGVRRASAQRRMSISSQREDSRVGSQRRSSRLLVSSSEMPPRRATPSTPGAGNARRTTGNGHTPRTDSLPPSGAPAGARTRTTTPLTRGAASRNGSGRLSSTTGGTGFGGRMNSPHAGARMAPGSTASATRGTRLSSSTPAAAARPRASSMGGAAVPASREPVAPRAPTPTATEDSLRQLKLERQFYFDKLRMIEKLVGDLAKRELTGDDVAAVTLARSVRDVLYATN